MSLINAIVIVIDRLGAGYLGPYGNTWSETPAFNQLASEAMLWENAFTDAPTLEGFYRAVCHGRHALSDLSRAERRNVIEQITGSGVNTILVSDDASVADHAFSQGFRERVAVPNVRRRRAAGSVDETQAAHTFAGALECLEKIESPFLLWVHLRGMSGAWDAPREFRERFADEEDPSPPDFVEPPERLLPEDADPDEILGVNHAYAGQVALNDVCLSSFLDAAAQLPGNQNTMLVVTSPRGYPLGEHGGLGSVRDTLHEEVLHIPLLIRLPEARGAMQRLHQLVCPADLRATLGAWFQVELESSPNESIDLLSASEQANLVQRDCIVSAMGEQRSLRTRAWMVIQDSDKVAQCFVKPDDRWEVNEVANRRGDIVEQALQALTAFEELARGDHLADLPKLADVLCQPPE